MVTDVRTVSANSRLRNKTENSPHLLGECVKRCTDRVTASKLGRLEPSDDVLQGGGYQEIFLLQPQLLTDEELQPKTTINLTDYYYENSLVWCDADWTRTYIVIRVENL